jgi:hypothetical protein
LIEGGKIVKLGPQMAIAMGVAYLLGRHRKLRTALVLGGAAAVGRFSRDPGQLVARGAKALTGSPELRKVAQLGGPLVAASKDAARAAVSNRIDVMSERLQDRSEGLRRPRRAADAGARGQEREEAPEEASDEAPEEEYEEYEDAEYEEEPPPPPRPPRTRTGGAPVRRRGRSS